MTTALDLITTAAKKLGAIGTGEVLTAAQGTDGLSALNSMLDSWALDRLLVFHVKQSSFSWPGSTSSRTIGSGGDFSTTRPTRIERGTFFRDTAGQDFPVEVTEVRSVYDSIITKTTSGTYPEMLFYDKSWPTGTLYVYPVPSSALTLYLNWWNVLQTFADLTTDLALPPGYQLAIENNLAIHLESVFPLTARDSVRLLAGQSKSALKRANHTRTFATTEAADVLGNNRSGRSHIEAGV